MSPPAVRSLSLSMIVLAGCDSGGSSNPDLSSGTMCAEGKIIANLAIAGTKRDDNKSGSPKDDPLRTIMLSDYQKEAGLKVLAIIIGTEWSTPTRDLQPEAVVEYKDWKTANKGVAILEAITQKFDHTSADMSTIDQWATDYKVPFDLTTDGTGALGPCSNAAMFPSQVVIRLSDMSIQRKHDGYMATAFTDAVDAALAK